MNGGNENGDTPKGADPVRDRGWAGIDLGGWRAFSWGKEIEEIKGGVV